MATERLRVILEMVTNQYKRGATDAARATDGITKSGQAADRAVSGLGTTMKRLVQGGAAIAVAQQLAQAIDKIRELNIEAEGIENQFNQVFGDGAEEVREWSDEVNERFGISERAVRQLASSMADLLIPIGFTRDEATGLAQDSLQLANALSEWTGGQIDVADATERIRKAILGEREGLEALNVKVLQSEVNARLLAAGQQNLTGEEKARAEALATLNIIQDKSTDAITAYERGTNKALIAQKELQAREEDRADLLADTLAPEVEYLTELMEIQSDALATAIEQLQDLQGAEGDTGRETRSLIERLVEFGATLDGPEGGVVGALLAATLKAAGLAVEVNRAREAVASATSPTEAYAQRMQGLADSYSDVAGTAGDAAKAIKEQRDAIRAATDPVFALRQAEEKYNEAFAERVRLQAEGASNREVLDALDDEIKARQDLTFAQEDFNTAADQTFSDLDTYAAKVGIQEDVWGLWKDEVLGLNQALSELDSLLGSGFSGRLPSPSSNPVPTFTDPFSSTGRVSGRAHGGAVSPSRSYIVGERGPELFRPTSSGRIEDSRRVAGGGDVYVNIHASIGDTALTDPGSARDFVRRLDRELKTYWRGSA